MTNRMIGEGISYANAKTYRNKTYACDVCGLKFNSIDNAIECSHDEANAITLIVRKDI